MSTFEKQTSEEVMRELIQRTDANTEELKVLEKETADEEEIKLPTGSAKSKPQVANFLI